MLYGNKDGNACVARPGVLNSLIDWLPMVGQSMTSCPLTAARMASFSVAILFGSGRKEWLLLAATPTPTPSVPSSSGASSCSDY